MSVIDAHEVTSDFGEEEILESLVESTAQDAVALHELFLKKQISKSPTFRFEDLQNLSPGAEEDHVTWQARLMEGIEVQRITGFNKKYPDPYGLEDKDKPLAIDKVYVDKDGSEHPVFWLGVIPEDKKIASIDSIRIPGEGRRSKVNSNDVALLRVLLQDAIAQTEATS